MSLIVHVFKLNVLNSRTCRTLQYVLNDPYFFPSHRLLWISFLLTSMTFVAVCLVQEFQSYFSYPFTSKSFLETFERMPFPAVTICNMGSKNRSKSSKSQKDADYWLSVSSVAVFATKKVDWNDSYYRENGYFEPNSLEKELNISMDVSKFILFSTFDFMTELVFKPTLTSLGICHTWNGDGNVTTKMTGSLYNLRVMLDIHRDLYEFGLTATTGVKVIFLDRAMEYLIVCIKCYFCNSFVKAGGVSPRFCLIVLIHTLASCRNGSLRIVTMHVYQLEVCNSYIIN